MKVLHLIGGEDFGGAKSHVISLVTELKKNIAVKIVTFRKGGFSTDAQKSGIDIEVVKTNSFIGDIRRVIQIIKDDNISLIHSHGAKANMFALLIKFFTHIPTVTTVHSDYRLDYMDNVLKKYSFGLINAFAIRNLDFRIGVSENFKRMLIQRGFYPQYIYKLYNGIQFDFSSKQYSKEDFLKRHAIPIKPGAAVVGILARLHPVKGIDVFLDAAGIVASKYPDTVFVIGGDGDERKNLEEKARQLGILHNTHFIGYVDDPYEFMECIDINTLTSLSESFPYVILEGANQRKTVICSNVGGISDLIVNGENGFLFEPGDYPQMARYVCELIENPTRRKNLGERLYLDAKETFSLDHMRKTQLKIYEDIFQMLERQKSSRYLYDVLLTGYYGFDNLGDDAMLEGIINSLKEIDPHIRIVILSKKPLQTSLRFGFNTINRINPFSILYHMRKTRLFVNGGGNLIQDTTSSRSLLYYLGTIFCAKWMGMKVMIYGNGIGPLIKTMDAKLSAKILNKVDVITLREKLSLEVLKLLDVTKPKISLTADPAMMVDVQHIRPKHNILVEYGLEGKEQLIGFSIRNFPGDGKKFAEFAKIADTLIERFHATPVFIPMHHPGDIQTAKKIVSLMKYPAVIIAKKYDVGDTLHLMSHLKLLIGMRLHSLIFALKLKVPMIGISYEPKVLGFLELIEQDTSFHINDIRWQPFIDKAQEIFAQHSVIKEDLNQKNRLITELSRSNAHFAHELLYERGVPKK